MVEVLYRSSKRKGRGYDLVENESKRERNDFDVLELPLEYRISNYSHTPTSSPGYDTNGDIHFQMYEYGDANYFRLRQYVMLEKAHIEKNKTPTVGDVLPALFDFFTDRFNPGDGWNIAMGKIGYDWSVKTIHVYNKWIAAPRLRTQELPFQVEWTYINEDDVDLHGEYTDGVIMKYNEEEWQVQGKWDNADDDGEIRTLARFKNPKIDIELFAVCALSNLVQTTLAVPCMIIMAHVYTPEPTLYDTLITKAVDQAYIHRIHASKECPAGIAKQLHQAVWRLLQFKGIEIANVQEPPTQFTPMVGMLEEIGFEKTVMGTGTAGHVLFKRSSYTKDLRPSYPSQPR